MSPADLSLWLSYVVWLSQSRAEIDNLLNCFHLWNSARLSSLPDWKGFELDGNCWAEDSGLLSETMGACLFGDQFTLIKHWQCRGNRRVLKERKSLWSTHRSRTLRKDVLSSTASPRRVFKYIYYMRLAPAIVVMLLCFTSFISRKAETSLKIIRLLKY